jgi:hypothetical protein
MEVRLLSHKLMLLALKLYLLHYTEAFAISIFLYLHNQQITLRISCQFFFFGNYTGLPFS